MTYKHQHLIDSVCTSNLGHLSYSDAINVLRARATVLDVKALPDPWKWIVKAAGLGTVDNMWVQGKTCKESVLVCVLKSINKRGAMKSVYTLSEYEFMLADCNAIWRREDIRSSHEKGKRVSFLCRYCNKDFTDKAELSFHGVMQKYKVYDYKHRGPLKMYPSHGNNGNMEIKDVFTKYGMEVPSAVKGKLGRPRANHQLIRIERDHVQSQSAMEEDEEETSEADS